MNKQISICIFQSSFLGGGVEKMMVYLANNFSKRGYKVDLIVVKNEGPYKKIIDAKVNVIDLNKKKTSLSIFKLSNYLRHKRPDVLLSASHDINIVACFANFLSLTKTRHVASVRSITSLNLPNQNNFFMNYIFKILIKMMYPKVYKIIAVSNDIKKDLIYNYNLNQEKIVVIPNMVDFGILKKLNIYEKRDLYDSCFTDGNYNSPIVISAGSLIKVKNFSFLVNSFSLVVEKCKKAKLIILGEGPERINLELLVDKLGLHHNVRLVGFRENLLEYMQLSTVFVSTSIHEGFGNVIIEAMSVGLPIIVTDCPGGPKEIVDNGLYGKIVSLDNKEKLASEILITFTSKHDTNLVIERSKQFSSEIITEKYIEMLLN
ncbi:MAG: glycosyltransferase [Bacteroidales bacterium]|nr:glycosyltransferase [Bacteroidales bacterium]